MSHNPLDAARDEGFIAGADSIHSETLRDRFAMAALTGFIASGERFKGDVAEASYRYADAMMEARK